MPSNEMPLTQLRKVRGRWRYGAKRLFKLYTPQRHHLASIPLFTYNFLIDGPTSTILGIKIDIDNQNKTNEINLRCHRTSRICMANPHFLAFVVSETLAFIRTNRQTGRVMLI